MRVMRDLTAGSVVTLRVWTGGGYRDVQVTTARYADVFKNQRFGMFGGQLGPGAMGFGPALDGMRIEIPKMRELHMKAPREVRIERRPGLPDKVTELRPAERPRTLTAPKVESTSRVITVPRIAPTPTGRRRFVI